MLNSLILLHLRSVGNIVHIGMIQMRKSFASRSVLALLISAILLPILAVALYRPMPVTAASCAEDANNLLNNGTMAPRDPDVNGVANKWKPFVVGANQPNFENAGNEGYDPNGSQYIWRDLDTWDAGIFQKVRRLTPGQTYHLWMVWGQALHDIGGNNARATLMNRQLGVDLTGGRNPTAPTVEWTVPYYGQSGFNRPEWNLTFTAGDSPVTIFLRAQNGHTDGRNKVFFDTACLYPAGGEPTSTPWASTDIPTNTPSPTATTTPTDTPTDTPTATPTPNLIEDTDPAIQYNGAWEQATDPGASEGTFHVARGAKGTPVSLSYTFTGAQVTIRYVGSNNYGKARVFIDGVKVGAVNQYAPNLTYNLSKTFGNLVAGVHDLKIKNAGARDVASTDSYITLDALEISESATSSALEIALGGRATRTPTPRWVPQIIPFAFAYPGADPPDDPTVIWDPRLPGLNVYLDPANVAPGTMYWKLIRADYQDGYESGGNHNMYYVVTDEQGNPVANQTVWQSWPDDSTSSQTHDDGTTDIAMWANYWPQNGPGPYNGYVGDLPSDVVRGMGLPGNNHVDFILYFQKTVKRGSGTPTNTDTPTATPTNPTGPTATPTFTPTATMTLPTATPSLVYYDDADPSIGYKGQWNLINDSNAYDETYHAARGVRGSAVVIRHTFTGTAVTLSYVGAADQGKAKILIDGVRVGKLDQYRPTLTYNLTHTFDNLSPGAHQLKIKNAGAKNSDSADSIITLDALIVTQP